MEKIYLSTLAERLSKAIGAPVGERGLNILLYGWKKHRKFSPRYCDALKHRDWLYITEVQDFSRYAGYDLSKSKPAPICESD